MKTMNTILDMDQKLKLAREFHAIKMQTLKFQAAIRPKRFKSESVRAQVVKELTV